MFTRSMRWTYLVFAWLFVALVVTQFFFAGLFLFGAGSKDLHVGLGYTLFFVAILYLLLAFAARLPWSWSGMTALLIVLVFVQPMLATAPIPLLAALHPVNALLIFTLALYLAVRARQFLPQRAGASGEAEKALSGSRA